MCQVTVSVPFYTYYQPGFLYNGNCSNAIFINYIPLMILTYMVTGIVFPFLYLFAMNYRVYEKLPKFIAVSLPAVFWPDKHKEFIKVLRTENFISSYVSHAAVLITFGAISPLLMLVIIVAMCSEFLCWQFMIWRFVKICHDDRLLQDGIERVEEECKDTWRTPKHTMWGMLMFSSFFYATVCFDMGFDDYRSDTSHAYLWTALLSIFFPLLVYIGVKIARSTGFVERFQSFDHRKMNSRISDFLSANNPMVFAPQEELTRKKTQSVEIEGTDMNIAGSKS